VVVAARLDEEHLRALARDADRQLVAVGIDVAVVGDDGDGDRAGRPRVGLIDGIDVVAGRVGELVVDAAARSEA